MLQSPAYTENHHHRRRHWQYFALPLAQRPSFASALQRSAGHVLSELRGPRGRCCWSRESTHSSPRSQLKQRRSLHWRRPTLLICFVSTCCVERFQSPNHRRRRRHPIRPSRRRHRPLSLNQNRRNRRSNRQIHRHHLLRQIRFQEARFRPAAPALLLPFSSVTRHTNNNAEQISARKQAPSRRRRMLRERARSCTRAISARLAERSARCAARI